MTNLKFTLLPERASIHVAANQRVIKAIVGFYGDDSDTVLLGLSCDQHPDIWKV